MNDESMRDELSGIQTKINQTTNEVRNLLLLLFPITIVDGKKGNLRVKITPVRKEKRKYRNRTIAFSSFQLLECK